MSPPPSRSRLRATLIVAMLFAPVVAVFVARAWLAERPLPDARPTPTPSAAPPLPSEDRTPEIRGRILDAEGSAVLGAAVRLVSPSLPYTILADTKSDATGSFSFPPVGAERVRVVADHDPDGAVTSAEIRLAQGQSTELTLVLAAASAVRGTVVDTQGHPVAGATIYVEGVPWIAGGATSDAGGAFRLATVPDGVTALVAVGRGYKTARVTLPHREGPVDLVVQVQLESALPLHGDVRDPDGNPLRARVVACQGQPSEASVVSAEDGVFELPSSTIGCDAIAQHDEYESSAPAVLVEGRRAELHLRPGGAIDGTVVDENGRTVESFTVGIESFSGAQSRSIRGTAARKIDDPRGAFHLERLAPGRYVLTAATPGRAPGRSDGVEVSGGTTVADIRIVLPAGGSLVGRVFDERHLPLEGVELSFDAVSSVVDSSSRARSDGTGQYRLDGAPAGPFTLRAQKAGYRIRLLSGLRVDSAKTVVKDVTLNAIDGGAGLEFAGIGANVTQTPEGLAFSAVFEGNPAERAGLRAGDRILGIDADSTDGMSITDALQRLRGEAGTSVGVSVRRPATGETVDVLVERAAIVR